MFYYEVQPVSAAYKAEKCLTYSSATQLKNFTLVSISMRNEPSIMGVIVSPVSHPPSFKVKALSLLGQQYFLPEVTFNLATWISEYYATPLANVLVSFIPANLQQNQRATTEKIELPKLTDLPPLTSQQKQVLKLFKSGNQSLMLHGDTGSGKTRVYIEMIQAITKKGRSSLVLTPEISLIPQLLSALQNTVSAPIFYIHSELTPAQRKRIWLEIHNASSPYVLIGPRSALFAPHKDVGLIVIDEFHESALKQEQVPRYHAVRVASKLRQLHNSQLVLGSATPPVEELYYFESKKLPIVTMDTLGQATRSAPIVVDLKDKASFTRSELISNQLCTAIEKRMANDEQVLLLLNRRGTARVIICNVCGWEMHCRRCDINVTYHGDSHDTRCHTCGLRAVAPSECPECQNSELLYQGKGTKAVAAEIERLFPRAGYRRFDTDNKKTERIDQHYAAIKSGSIPILIGTQLIAKGLDLPKLSLVGVLNADTGMVFPDFTAEEKTYQLLYQVIGRVNRGHLPGEVILQSLHPDAPVLKAALDNNWYDFYNSQLAEREQFSFPPFAFLLKITAERRSSKVAEKALQTLQRQIEALGLPVRIDNPAPGFVEKKRNNFIWHLVVRSKNRGHLVAIAKAAKGNFSVDLDPISVL